MQIMQTLRRPLPKSGPMTNQNVAIVGVGLIGGSIGLALRQRGLAAQVIGIGRRQTSLDKALACGAIDRAELDLKQGVASADVVIVASPVASVVDQVCQALASAGSQTRSQALVTDVGSTKATICAGVEKQAKTLAPQFVGSHPLAGDHRTGPENARADLLEGKTVVITPTKNTLKDTADRAEAFWQALDAQVVRMSPDEHDLALAATSHLPHLVASALAAATPDEWLSLVATGWADTTRVAAADPELWTQIFSQNKTALLKALDRLADQIDQLRAGISAENWSQIQDTLQKAKRTRDALGN